MPIQIFKTINYLLLCIVLISIGCSVWFSTGLFAFFGVGGYLALSTLLKTRVAGVLTDERQQEVSAKASQASFKVLIPILLLTSLALWTSGGEYNFYYIKALGIVFSYVTGLGIAIYCVTYWYFDRKTGGNEK